MSFWFIKNRCKFTTCRSNFKNTAGSDIIASYIAANEQFQYYINDDEGEAV